MKRQQQRERQSEKKEVNFALKERFQTINLLADYQFVAFNCATDDKPVPTVNQSQ